MDRPHSPLLTATMALLVLVAMLAVPATAHAQDDGDDVAGAKDCFPAFITSLRGGDYSKVVHRMAPNAVKVLTVLTVQALRSNPAMAVPVNELLTEHKATALANVPPRRLDAMAALLKNEETQLPEAKDLAGLLVKLLDLGMKHNMTIMPAPDAGIGFSSGEPDIRGELAWVPMVVTMQGRQQNGAPVVCQRVDGTWKLLAFNATFQNVAALVMGRHVESAGAWDAMAVRVTRNRLRAIADATAGLETAPTPATDGNTAGLLKGLQAAGVQLPGDSYADGRFIDVWERPVTFTAGTAGGAFALTSPGPDGTAGTDDDLSAGPTAPANPRVELVTNKGRVVIELYEDVAPNSVANFINLVEAGFYNGTKFHRIIDGFMIQGGDPNTRTNQGMPGTGDAGYNLPDEMMPDMRFDAAGILAYANGGPNTSSCQFFITLDESAHLNDRVQPNGSMIHYTILGKVIEGLDVVKAVGKTPVGRSPNGEMSVPREEVVVTSSKVLSKRSHGYPVIKLPRGR